MKRGFPFPLWEKGGPRRRSLRIVKNDADRVAHA